MITDEWDSVRWISFKDTYMSEMYLSQASDEFPVFLRNRCTS